MAFLQDTDRFQVFIDFVISRAENLDVFDCPGGNWGRLQGEVTFKEGLVLIQTDPLFRIEWRHWVRSALSDLLVPAHRLIFTRGLLGDPRRSASAYTNIPNLSGREDEELMQAWHSSRRVDRKVMLPQIEAELLDGRVIRAKV